jgi:hypothetical protein
VRITATIEAPPSCGSRDEAQLNKIGLDHVLDRITRLTETSRERFNTDWTTPIKVRDHHQVPAVHRVKAKRIDF